MSINETEVAPRSFRRILIPLLQEYNKKLLEIASGAHETLEQSRRVRQRENSSWTDHDEREQAYLLHRYHGEMIRCNRLADSCRQLARRVSQQLEHSRIDEFDRIELELRLAELEATLLWVTDELQAGLGFVTS